MQHRFHGYFGGHGGRGRFGKGFMDGGMGGRAFGMGRKLGSVDLQLLILRLLADKPRHGYEIIQALDDRSQGFYVPSPGMVYPALAYLEETGHAIIEVDGNRKRYYITEAGQRHLEQHRTRADALLAQFERLGQTMDRMRRAIDAGAADDEPAGHESRGSHELLHARHGLGRALAGAWDSPREEQKRITEILKRATAEILRSASRK